MIRIRLPMKCNVLRNHAGDTQRLRQICFLRKALLQEFLFAAVTMKIHDVSQSS